MSAMAEKLKEAGVDTVGAQLVAACTEGLRRHPDSVIEAWHYAGSVFGHEFVRGLMKDMRGDPKPAAAPKIDAAYVFQGKADSKPYQPRVIPPERLEKRRQLQQVVRSKYKNSGDVPWSDVGWHELRGLTRDGKEATALLEAGPANVPNDGRNVGQVLGIKRVDQIIEAVRA